jgi:PAS domain S-box-containing protein
LTGLPAGAKSKLGFVCKSESGGAFNVNPNTEIQQIVATLMHSVIPLVVQRDGVIVHANEAAYRVMRYDPGVSFVGTQIMQFVDPAERSEAAQIMQLILQKRELVRSVLRLVVNGEGKTVRILATVMPIQWQGGQALAITFSSLDDTSSDSFGSRGRTRRARSIESLGLSPREKQVAMFVAQGFSVQNIAALLQIQRETVRTHIKSIYRKTSTHTRVELTRTMLAARGGLPKQDLLPLRRRLGSRRSSSLRAEN